MEVLSGLSHAEQERAAALRERGRFFWLDMLRDEASRDDLVETLGISDSALRALWDFGDAHSPRTFHADGDFVVFAFRCYVGVGTPVDGARLRPLDVHVVVTGEYLLTLHEEDVSLPAVLGPRLPAERGREYAVYSGTRRDAGDHVSRAGRGRAGAGRGRGDLDRRRRWAAAWATLRECASRLATMRRWVAPSKTVFERAGVEIGALRGFDRAGAPYFDRLDRQLNRLLASVDAAASAMGTLLDLQLNERAYVVSVVATIFGLIFITGFFGMNFGWMVDQINTQAALAARAGDPDRDRSAGVAPPGAPVSDRRRPPAGTPLSRTRRAVDRGLAIG